MLNKIYPDRQSESTTATFAWGKRVTICDFKHGTWHRLAPVAIIFSHGRNS
jgi:hypothetical protein